MTMLVDQHGRPMRRPRRAGAGRSGSMRGWSRHTVHPAEAERQMALVADRARDLYTNDAMGHGIVEALAVEAVGTGLTPQAAPVIEELGWTPEQGRDFAAGLGRLFRRWGLGARKSCDLQGRLNFYQLQGLQYFNWKLDGIGAAQIAPRRTPHSPLSLAILPIDALRIATPTRGVERGADIYDGVEVDAEGRPVAIHLLRRGLSRSAADMLRLPVWDEVTGLPRVLLTYSVRNIAEYRQDSILGCMMKELRDNSDFIGAAVTRAMLANMFVAAIHSPELSEFRSAQDLSERIQELESGIFLQATADERIEFLENSAPGAGFRDMTQGVVDRLGMATGRGPENVARKYQASYSASRASMVKADQFNAFEHLDLVSSFCQPAWCWMVYAAALEGLLGDEDPARLIENLDAYAACEWLPQPRAYLDPSKTAAGHKTELEIGTESLHRIAAEKGLDWRELVRQRVEERAFQRAEEERLGLAPAPASSPDPPTAPSRDKEDDDAP